MRGSSFVRAAPLCHVLLLASSRYCVGLWVQAHRGFSAKSILLLVHFYYLYSIKISFRSSVWLHCWPALCFGKLRVHNRASSVAERFCTKLNITFHRLPVNILVVFQKTKCLIFKVRYLTIMCKLLQANGMSENEKSLNLDLITCSWIEFLFSNINIIQRCRYKAKNAFSCGDFCWNQIWFGSIWAEALCLCSSTCEENTERNWKVARCFQRKHD